MEDCHNIVVAEDQDDVLAAKRSRNERAQQ